MTIAWIKELVLRSVPIFILFNISILFEISKLYQLALFSANLNSKPPLMHSNYIPLSTEASNFSLFVWELNKNWFWIKLCWTRLVQGDWDYKMDRKTCTHVGFYLSSLIKEHLLLCIIGINYLVSASVTALEKIADRSKTQMQFEVLEVETATKKKLCAILKQLSLRHNRAESDAFFRWLRCSIKGARLIHPVPANAKNSMYRSSQIGRYCNVLPDFDFNSKMFQKSDKILSNTDFCM